MSVLEELNFIVTKAFKDSGYDIKGDTVRLSDRSDLSQFQSNIALLKAKDFKENPRVIAEKVVDKLKENKVFKIVSVDGPGFINLTLSEDYLANYIENNFEEIDFKKYNKQKRKIVIDYGGPNVAKPLHVGHLRPAIIGESLKRLAKELGNEVIGDVHLGDWGRPMGMIISELKHRKPELVYFDPNYKGEYPKESPVTVEELNEIYPTATKKAKEDETRTEEARETTSILQNKKLKGHRGYYALWKQFVKISIEDLKKDYNKLDVKFDLWIGESDCNDSIPNMIKAFEDKNLVENNEGTLIVNVSEEKDKISIPPIILKTKNDSVGYQTTELATIYERMKEYNPNEIWYVVDARQSLHFTQVFRAAYKSGIVKKDTGLYFIGFGTMNGKDGKPFKTRDGGVMRLSELLRLTEEVAFEKIENKSMSNSEKKLTAKIIANGAIKYADAISNRMTDYIFDIDKFTDNNGKTGPYILYSVVRIKSLLNKAIQQGEDINGKIKKITTDEERKLILEIIKLPNVVLEAYNNKSLSEIVNYLYDLDSAYNTLYNNYRILTEKDSTKKETWLKLSNIVKKINEKLLYIMAIEIPDKM